MRKLRQDEAEDGFGEKLQRESVLVNHVLRAARWEAMRVCFWKSKVHINLLETSVVASLLKQMMRSHPGTRLNILLDSSVAKGALAKGRSSSRRAAACQIAGNLYPAHSYAPTKLNVADDPTRDAEIRLPSTLRLRDLLPVDVLRELHWSFASRSYANWIRLVVLAYLCSLSHAWPSARSVSAFLRSSNVLHSL